jgi:hypothetical protein
VNGVNGEREWIKNYSSDDGERHCEDIKSLLNWLNIYIFLLLASSVRERADNFLKRMKRAFSLVGIHSGSCRHLFNPKPFHLQREREETTLYIHVHLLIIRFLITRFAGEVNII